MFNESGFYDLEIVFFVDELDRYMDILEFSMIVLDGIMFVICFVSVELNYVICWIFYNGDQQVVVFVLFVICWFEGFFVVQ